uniref:Uncharacterized protein n=1 Tax=Amphora coffeiformis TaxID=265554 RepID=A0A7S3L832_9STRA|mmetsp:Transcript_16949/g.34117  ORF Transcript_16949/g.34117 Transcript_16949/m.34117 type:complete len:280 (-) Transcript_16949:57-896(-)
MSPLRLLLILLCCSVAVPPSSAGSLRTSTTTTRSLMSASKKIEKRLKRKEKRLARRNKRRRKKAEVIAARLERIKDKPRNICPITKPVEGSSCQRNRRLPACEYEFLNAPTVSDDGSCSESIGCVPYSSCSCSLRRKNSQGTRRRKVWECSDNDFATCQGVESFNLSNACNPEAEPPTSTPTLSPVENVFQRDEEACPLQLPQNVSSCQRNPDLLECGYNYYNSPTFEENGSCVLPLQCVPEARCNCFDGKWDCWTETQRRCSGPPPPESLTSCTPNGR